ncbi:MAG: hypothetical protein KJO76_09250 [Gammaproteobacteria bacterium]|nr:hypothetical protein [Gammaproteobacteria bacterium]MBT8444100.1 hypothetical protein [Gammaproteobacteria bacterium]NND37932.1 hypothetical protein [Gammaproteobacteria bacterium]
MTSQNTIDDQSVRFFELRDVGLILGLAGLALISWVWPERYWQVFTRMTAAVVCPVLRLAGRGHTAIMSVVLEKQPANFDVQKIENANFAARLEEQLQYLREYRPGGWQPSLRMAGAENVERALQRGTGCILWIDPLVFCPLVAKKALHAAGYPPSHLSRYYHGPSNSEFGRRFINVITSRCEDRYLATRLIMKPGSELVQTRRLCHLLKSNEVVSIACSHHGASISELPINVGRLPCATGAPTLAVDMNAPLLPVSVATASAGGFEITIGAPLPASPAPNRRAAVRGLLAANATRLESIVNARPASFAAWRNMRLPTSRG